MMKVFNILCKIFHEFQYVFIVLIDALRKSFQENLKKIWRDFINYKMINKLYKELNLLLSMPNVLIAHAI